MTSAIPDDAPVTLANIHVPRGEFVSVWREAARHETGEDGRAGDNWYAAAVAQTCRWMAALPPKTALCGGQTRSPVTLRANRARPQLIDAECAAAAQPDLWAPELAARPGWHEGVRATFEWAWRGAAAPPIAAEGT